MFTENEKTRLAVGLKETKKAIASGVERVYIAEDAPAEIKGQIEAIAADKVFYVSTMRELGALCGIDVKATCAAIRL